MCYQRGLSMFVTILHNHDHALLEDDPGREARADVVNVAAAMADALSGGKRRVLVKPVDDVTSVADALGDAPDVVVNLCESLGADSRGESLVPAMLELAGLCFTGSSSLALALSLHKNKAKEILSSRGVPTPRAMVIERVEDLVTVDLAFPLIVKPTREDASMGIGFDSVVRDRASLGKAVSRVLRTFHQPALVEQYVEGREIYVPLLGNAGRRALPLTEIQFGAAFADKPKVLSYTAKWDTSSPECLDSPSRLADLPRGLQQRCIAVALDAFEALECRDYGRVDLRVDASGQPWVIDINPNCDLHPQAGYSRSAQAAGLSYQDLALHLIELAQERHHGHQARRLAGPNAARRAAAPHRDLLGRRGGLRARADRRRRPAE
ncbi:MAG: ATP-grasp domain-containing protein [Myxococcaceae bacterium]|nr:ATP-grasp domain-containing protein [Myxococcaceae bacterium]